MTVILFVIFSDLRSDNRTTYLEGIKSAFNFRVEKNLQTMEDCHGIEGFTGYLQDFLHVINQLSHVTICELNFSFFPTELEKMKKGESDEFKGALHRSLV